MVARWGSRVGHLHWGWDRWWHGGGWRVADPPNSPQHLTWEDACRILPRRPDKVFAVVRDPVARMVSEYRWQRQGRRGTRLGKILAYLPFSLWLRVMFAITERNPYAFDNHFRAQSDFVPETARIFRLEDGLKPVLAWLGSDAMEEVQDVPHAIPAKGPATRIKDADRARIVFWFGEDFRRFGYPMPCPPMRPDGFDCGLRWVGTLLARLERRGLI